MAFRYPFTKVNQAMAKIGSPVTTKFPIGTAELRVGPMTSAGRLTQANSVGLVDEAAVEVTQNSVDLKGLFPQLIVDTAIVDQEAKVTASLRESSRRNLKIMLGEGLDAAPPADVSSLVVTDVIVDGTGFDVTAAEGALFTVGDIVVIYPDGRPQDVVIDQITVISTDTITVENGLAVAVSGTTETVHIYKANQVAIGGASNTKYFAATVVQVENSTGRPVGFDFWKAASSGSMNYATNATDFGSLDMELKVLAPAIGEYGAGGDLEHLDAIIPTHPSGMFFGGGD